MQVDLAKLRVLIAGCGSIGKRHAQVLAQIGITHLAACDPGEEARASFAALVPDCKMYTEYQQALIDFQPDAVFILTPTRLHLSMATQAVLTDCHVFIEKPLSNTTEGALALYNLAQKHHKQVMVGFCFRYHAALLEAKKRIESGEIGRIVSIRALMGEPFYEIHPDYLNLYYSKYSGAFELVHDLDLAIWFAGQDIESVQAVYGSFSDMGMESPDTVEMLVKFQDRCVANVHLDFFQMPRRRQIDLIGTNGVITVEFASWDEATLRCYTKQSRAWEQQAFKTQRNDMFIAEDLEFFACMQSGHPVRCNIPEALKSLSAIAHIYKPY